MRRRHPRLAWPWLLLFLALVLGGGWAIGTQVRPDAWFRSLAKPAFNPPDAVFAPVWTILYILIAIAGWRTFGRTAPGHRRAAVLWTLQLLLNFAWSPVFFGAHRIGLALAVIVALLLAIMAFIAATWRADRPSALLFLPYAAWVAFATVLNAAFLALNR